MKVLSLLLRNLFFEGGLAELGEASMKVLSLLLRNQGFATAA